MPGPVFRNAPERLLLLRVVLALLDDLDDLGRAVANEKGGGVLGDHHFLASPRLWGVRAVLSHA